MPQWKPPGQDDYPARLARLENRIAELGRQSNQRDRLRVRLATTVSGISSGESRVVTSWETAPVDPANMYRRNVGGATYVELPYAGRWRVRLDAGIDRPSSDRHFGCWIKLNSDTSTAFDAVELPKVLTYDSKYIRTAPGYNRVSVEAEHVFATGDHISFGFWGGGVSGTSLQGADLWPLMPTYFVVEYLGPR